MPIYIWKGKNQYGEKRKGEMEAMDENAVHAHLKPEPGNIQQGVLNVCIVEVQVRLRREEIVKIVLQAARVPLPRRTAKDRQPVVGW